MAGSGLHALAALAAATLMAGACAKPPDGAPGRAPGQPKGDAPWLVEVEGELGVDFAFDPGPHRLHMAEMMAGGVAVFDADGDGDLDLYFTNGGVALSGQAPGPDDARNAMFRQEADGRFTDVTATCGAADAGFGFGVAAADYDNDGDVDLYVANHGPDRLFRNRGDGTFDDVTEEAGVDVPGWSTSVAFLDYDNDGLLDLWICQYAFHDDGIKCFGDGGAPDYCGPKAHPPASDVVLHAEGGGRFRDVSAECGAASVRAAGLGVVCEDFDLDGFVDVYVANDGYAANLWLNQRDGTFKDEGLKRGCAYNIAGQAEAGMGVLADDVTGDTLPELFKTHLRYESNTLYRNLGQARFRDETARSGLGPSSFPFTGFGVVAVDFELDGDLDLAIANGRVNLRAAVPGAEPPAPWDRLAEPNLLYLNDGQGGFALEEKAGGSFTSRVEISRALATGDLDRDGDVDLVLTNVAGPARIYRNDAPRQGRWLAVRAWDPASNRAALGAQVTVVAGDFRRMRSISPGTSYLSSCEPTAWFGLGPRERVDHIEVRWLGGLVEVFPGTETDRTVDLRRGEGRNAS